MTAVLLAKSDSTAHRGSGSHTVLARLHSILQLEGERTGNEAVNIVTCLCSPEMKAG